MATWQDMAKANMEAAKCLHDQGLHRPSVTRAYYSAYCALTQVLKGKHQKDFKYGGNNPAHNQLLALVRNNLELGRTKRPADLRRMIGRSLNILLNLRIEAEYVPGHTIGHQESLNAVHMANGILQELGLTT
jgi:uncharacterized protein (UPF0332 family)